ncbi:hypothetical protein [Bdellovibrio sp. HCB337]|uniref:hypothetical protein n=1 Tax=Bdellovibrio sp. HCB337 TaxID=3394358 RepID=UPI0039A4D0C4
MVRFGLLKLMFVALFVFSFSRAQAEVLFEGYSKILSNGAPIGYTISKYEFDAKSKKFISTYFLKTAGQGMEITESLKAYANEELGPISYAYTSIVGKETKTIDAKFTGLKMNATVKAGGKTQTIRKDLPKGTFLSTFLVYLMLKSKDGLKTDANYDYQAIAEEDAEVYKGQASVGKEEAFLGLKAFKVQNKFKDVRFVSFVNERGEALGTSSASQGVSTELVADPSQATNGFPTSATILKSLFGEVPAGKTNMLTKSANIQPANPGKQQGIPQGQGIQLKTEPAASPAGK